MKKKKQSQEKTRDWSHYRDMWIRVLEKKTGQGLSHWNAIIRKQKFTDEHSLRDWLAQQGINGYAKQILVMERFCFPDFLTTPADELIDAQYADRPHLRRVYEAIIRPAISVSLLSRRAKDTS